RVGIRVKTLLPEKQQPTNNIPILGISVRIPHRTTVSWDGDKLLCVQNGEKEGRGWTQWIEGDEMHLEIRVCGVKCKQVFKKVQ
uniref:Uncharacterized protein n=1 Tax=Buteo japonicus TaxID=224669 RepID=A0A8C0B3L9_9AVES